MADLTRPLSSEELDVHLNQLLDEMEKAGVESNRLAREEKLDRSKIPSRSRPREEVFNNLKTYVEDEVPVASRLHGDAEINPREEHREIEKRALANLKLPQLRALAEDAGIPKSGRREELLDRLVRRYGGDDQEIARLVLLYQEDLRADVRHTMRLFPLHEPIRGDDLDERLRRYVGRYFKVEIAQWFLFREIRELRSGVRVRGTHRAYRVDATETDDDGRSYELQSRRVDREASADLRLGSMFFEVKADGARESRAIAQSIELATGMLRRPRLPIGAGPIWDDQQWDPGTLVVLDLLNTTFRSENLHVANLTMAGFEMGVPSPESDDARSSSKPEVRSVRFHGQHILDSRPACELISQHERLAHVALLARFRPTGGADVFHLPVRIDLEQDNAVIMTGFGGQDPAVSELLQRSLVREVEKKLIDGPTDLASLQSLVGEIVARSRQVTEPERATMFADPADDGDPHDQAVADEARDTA